MTDDDSQREVLSSLPRSRPTRRSAKRDGGRRTAAGAASAPARAAADVNAAAKPKAAAKAKAKPKSAAKPKAKAAAKPKARSTASAKPKAAASAKPKATASAKPKATASAKPKAPRKQQRPKAAPPAGWETDRDANRAAGGTELVTTAVKAVGEVAQIGAAVGGQAIKSVLGRLPRP